MSGMNKQLTAVEQSNLPGIPVEVPSMMELVMRAARDPDIDVSKMERLMQMAREMRQEDAKTAYIKALVKMKPKLPVIDRRGRIEVRAKSATGHRDGEITQNTPYALWEDIDEAITPILEEHGFVLTHRCGTAADGKILITGVLSHEAGHSEETTMALPHDSSGSKNAVQAVGSSTQYGKRYTAGLLLNIRTRGQDDDGIQGGTPGTLNEDQIEKVFTLIQRVNADKEKFCEFMGAKSVPDILSKDFEKAMFALNTKATQAAKKKESAS